MQPIEIRELHSGVIANYSRGAKRGKIIPDDNSEPIDFGLIRGCFIESDKQGHPAFTGQGEKSEPFLAPRVGQRIVYTMNGNCLKNWVKLWGYAEEFSEACRQSEADSYAVTD